MSTQDDRAPFSNVSTSLEAAARVAPAVATQKQRVLELLQRHGEMTDHAIGSMLHLGERQASTRRNALVRDGLVRDSGKRQKNPRTGCMLIVWEVASGDPPPAKAQTHGRTAAAVSRVRLEASERIHEILCRHHLFKISADSALEELAALAKDLRERSERTWPS